MRKRPRVGDVVDADPVDVRAGLVGRSEDVPSYAPEAVDSGSGRHGFLSLGYAGPALPQGPGPAYQRRLDRLLRLGQARRGGLSPSLWTPPPLYSPRSPYSRASPPALTPR